MPVSSVPMIFTPDHWLGNGWPSIEIDPVETNFLAVLTHLAATYHFPLPPVIDILDGYAADFVILGSPATMHLDTWSFSIAFAQTAIRNRVLADLRKLPPNFFPE